MDAPINAYSFLNFLAYAGIGIGVLVLAALAVSMITPHRELSLIRAGNSAAATGFAGTLIGLALPLHSAISNSVSLVDAAIWGAVSVVVQLFAFLLARLVSPKLSQQITEGQIGAGVFSAGVSVSVGLINAAAMTP